MFKDNDIPWVLKGGHALELRLQESRGTKDIDLSLRDMKFFKGTESERTVAIKEALIERSRIDLGDFFEFLITGPKFELDSAPYGGARFQVEALIDGKRFTIFDIDIGIGDVWIEPHDELEMKNLLEFAEFETPKVSVICLEQHLSEKIHAYTLPRENENSRVKDFVDIYLILKKENLNTVLLKRCLSETFDRRATHSIPRNLEVPPLRWAQPYKGFGIEVEMLDCYRLISKFWEKSV